MEKANYELLDFLSPKAVTVAIDRRLSKYGYTDNMTPQKYQDIMAVRRILGLITRMPLGRSNPITKDEYDAYMRVLDQILPLKITDRKDESTCHNA